MENSWRIGLFVGLAILGGWDAAEAQTPPAAGTADRTQSAPRRTAPATAAAGTRRRSDPYFNRVVTTGHGPVASEARGPDDPFRPYSAGVREADARAAMGSTRARPRAVEPPRPAPSSHNYYPGLRTARHPNANVPRGRSRCVPSRGSMMTGGLGRGR